MKVAVIHPYRENVHKFYKSYYFEPERTVQVATYLDNRGFDVDFIDFGQTDLEDDHTFTVPVPEPIKGQHNQMWHYGWTKNEIDKWFVRNEHKYTHYVVDALTPYFKDSVQYIHSKIQSIDKPLVFFGEWPQLRPEDFRETPAVTDNWEAGVEDWLLCEYNNNYWLRDREPPISFSFEEYPMDETPCPNWRLFTDEDDYPEPHNADIRLSRGCVERCDFCHVAGMYDGRFNFKTPDKIEEDLENLIERQGFEKITIRDDNFCAATETAKEVFQTISERWPDIEIMQPEGMEMRTASRDRELIQAIGDCNYHSIRVGFETATDGKFSKNNLEWWEKAHEYFNDAGFGPGDITTFVIRGHPKMDRKDEIHTAIYLSQFDVTMVSGGYRLVPGTELWEDHTEENGDVPYEYGFGLPNDDPMIDKVGSLYRTVTHWNEWGLDLFNDPNVLEKFEQLSWIDNVVDDGDKIYCEGTVSGWRRTEGIEKGFAMILALRGYYTHRMPTETKREMEVVGSKGYEEFKDLVTSCAEDRGIKVDNPGGLI